MSQKTTRYQLRIGGVANEILTDMCAQLEADPKTVILDALSFYHFAMDAAKEGLQVGKFDDARQAFTAVVTPSLYRLIKKSRPQYEAVSR